MCAVFDPGDLDPLRPVECFHPFANPPLFKDDIEIAKSSCTCLAVTPHLLHNIKMDGNVVLISRKKPPKESKAPEKFTPYVSKKEIEKKARPGETYDQVRTRLSNKGNIESNIKVLIKG
ncbi:hypothetical protein BHECKSOX_583 [Bathymodiolus heckerae thiotrophic gill symbiont]|uniref:hypothetical protein n=1 Tax=Bathymodiolus heckerae thiotrophic gill symbiont TaxID=1052212 RepID=UPI0010BA9205|nr:hypothetical protein [Bathymodiolus heckerae thiotrophic gill symbiont]SHN92376.1 hypothetical protein BHECKSOX_583 [Bathymodiolus heckerae thiotrophic gill symbiont]